VPPTTQEQRVARRRAAVPEITYPPQLPVSARKDDLLAAIRDHQVVVVAGETGSGKTTQLPKICLELGRGVERSIVHTQPRRIAARTVAQRIADELGVELGGVVGYAVRFDDRSADDTLVRLVTDGLLLAEIQRDPLLRRYDTVIVDEAHERSLNVDFLLGCIKRILPQRPDLKLIITSATIDPGRFSAHFDDAPVVEVSGRTFPVEVRYRPVNDPDAGDAERDQVDAIGDAVEELIEDGKGAPGDVLVFLSGEREIRDAADGLTGRFGGGLEVLPLYARLSTAEQQRVFRSDQRRTKRRVVLATNVAETSLTVPGIKYVVDPGTARISRYSARLKVQRLPIEKVSQASADQRKGRCGRTSDGVCIRLYSEQDFLDRPRYTDPEILRTSLAAVMLQMAAVHLGDVEDFPFLDPPDARQVRDAVNLLQELGALRDGRGRDGARELTRLGRQLARIPLDPRMARMVVQADRLGCLEEVIVIAAALSMQDPRERPAEKRGTADQLHARFADEQSDFVSILNLWRHLREERRSLSRNQFRKRCQKEFLHYLRVREWQDLVAQVRDAAKDVGLVVNQQPAEPPQIHQALLAGLLSHVGLKDERKRSEYEGARGARFAIFPGSVLAKKPPDWVMAAELVETSRLWGRTAARIDPKWIEPLAGHLLKRHYSEPRWSRKRASAVATERATLYGLPVVVDRTVAYGRIDPVLARELFIRSGLVEEDWHGRHDFLEENRRRREEARELEERERRRGLVADDSRIHAFYEARIPAEVTGGAEFDRWWKDERHVHPDLLTIPPEELLEPHAATLDPKARPTGWRQDGQVFRLSYRFEPGTEHDGVTVHVPLGALGTLTSAGFEWLVPGMRPELVTTLIRMVPKDLRRALVPVPDVADDVLASISPRREPLLPAVAAALERLRGVRVPPGTWSLDGLPAHLRMTFQIEGPDGEVVAEGHDLDALRAELRPRLQAELAAARPDLWQSGLTAWPPTPLAREIDHPVAGASVRAYPGLVDEGTTVGVRVYDTPQAQAVGMATGTRRLLLLAVGSVAKRVQADLTSGASLSLATAPHGSLAAVIDDATAAALDALIAEAGGPAWDAAGFERLRRHVAGALVARTAAILRTVVAILDAGRDVQLALDDLSADAALQPARLDVARQLGRLVYPGFVAFTGAARLPDVERYLRAATQRLQRLPTNVAVDRDKMTAVHGLENAYRARVEALGPGAPVPPALRDVAWMLEELRVSHFAQGLGVRDGVSAKKVRKALLAL
jgi:ATP-dependent helicase HrpA